MPDSGWPVIAVTCDGRGAIDGYEDDATWRGAVGAGVDDYILHVA